MFITKKIFFLIVQFARQHTSKSSFPAAPVQSTINYLKNHDNFWPNSLVLFIISKNQYSSKYKNK